MKTKIAYGFGDLASNLLFQMTVIYLLFFYTDILGISAISAGIIFLIARLWDAVNDPMMGLVMDKTKSKHGKARVYIKYGSLPLALATIAMFYAPQFSLTGKVIYAGVTYIIWGMLYTLVNIPYSSLTASLTDIPQERTALSSIRMIFMLIGVITVSVVTEPFVSSFSTLSKGYFGVSILFGGLAFLFFQLCFKYTNVSIGTTRKRNETYRMRDIWPLLLQNKPLLIVTLASLVGNMAIFIRETAAIYYVTYNLGRSDFLPIFLGVIVLAMLISNLVIPFATRKWDKKGTYIIGSCIGVMGSIIFYFIPYDQLYLVLLFAAISSFGIAAISTIGWAMIPDTIEYGEWKTGTRAEGISYAIYSFSQKLATAVAGILVASVLELTNYIPGAVNQSSKALFGILSTLTFVPSILIILSVLIIMPYCIDAQFYKNVMEALHEN